MIGTTPFPGARDFIEWPVHIYIVRSMNEVHGVRQVMIILGGCGAGTFETQTINAC